MPSIAAISRTSITSAQRDSEDAWCLKVEGGVADEAMPAPYHQGTQIEIRDLFYAVPARLKFLKNLPMSSKEFGAKPVLF